MRKTSMKRFPFVKGINMSGLLQIVETEADFEAATKSGLVLVDFFATWCRPCRMQMPILEEIAPDFDGKVKFVKVDIDVVKPLAEKFSVSSVPTLVVLKDGQKVDQFVGLQQGDKLKAALSSLS
jgi:thioredoxin 1